MRLASIRTAAKWQGCAGLACTCAAAPVQTPGLLAGGVGDDSVARG